MGMQSIKVLGTGCKACHTLLKNTKEAVQKLNLPIDIEYITDLSKIMAYGAMRMPVLVVDEKVVLEGQVPKAKEILELLKSKA